MYKVNKSHLSNLCLCQRRDEFAIGCPKLLARMGWECLPNGEKGGKIVSRHLRMYEMHGKDFPPPYVCVEVMLHTYMLCELAISCMEIATCKEVGPCFVLGHLKSLDVNLVFWHLTFVDVQLETRLLQDNAKQIHPPTCPCAWTRPHAWRQPTQQHDLYVITLLIQNHKTSMNQFHNPNSGVNLMFEAMPCNLTPHDVDRGTCRISLEHMKTCPK